MVFAEVDIIVEPGTRLAVPEIKTFASPRFSRRARYVRVQAIPLPTIPVWHRAIGNPSWIFTDEIIVN